MKKRIFVDILAILIASVLEVISCAFLMKLMGVLK
jgi:hypothetical protein